MIPYSHYYRVGGGPPKLLPLLSFLYDEYSENNDYNYDCCGKHKRAKLCYNHGLSSQKRSSCLGVVSQLLESISVAVAVKTGGQ